MFLKNVNTLIISALIAVACFVASCSHISFEFELLPDEEYTENNVTRLPGNEFRRVFIVYSMGFNNLSRYLTDDVEDLISSPLMSNDRDILLIFSHRANWYTNERYPRYSELTCPSLTRISKGRNGEVIRDTLLVLPQTTSSADPGTLNEVLTFIHENIDAESYGMLMSSHGTGWAPEDYCNHPYVYDENASSGIWRLQEDTHIVPKPFAPFPSSGDMPAVKSIGVQNITTSSVKEMDITDVAQAIPMKLDFIIFDACFMGGIEVAYQFRHICDKMAFSQTEILAEGMDYTTMASYIYNGMKSPDLEGFCRNYYEFYLNNKKGGDYRSATISLVDCTRLEPLAEICREIFDANRVGLAAIEGNSKVQRYYRSQYADYQRWFFDLYDIAAECGASYQHLTALDAALEQCIIYKAATPNVLGIKITDHCGLSMYLPYRDLTYLNNFYKTLDWNKATGLVQ